MKNMFGKIKKIFVLMRKYFDQFDILTDRFTWKGVMFFIIIAYIFSVVMRFIWILAFVDYKEFFWNGQLIPTTHDAFFWGSIIQKALWGMHADNRLVPAMLSGESAHLVISYLLVKFSLISLETAIAYLPIFISSLIVIPIILIGRLYNNTFLGWCAAIVACIVPSFYQRTLAGYFDTDMFSLFFVVLILYFLLASIEKKKLKYAYLATVAMVIAPFFYLKITPIIYAIIVIYIIYNLIWRKKEKFVWESILLLTFIFWSGNFFNYLSLGAFNIGWIVNLMLVSIIYKLIANPRVSQRWIIYFAIVSIFFFFIINSPLQSIYDRVYQYSMRDIAPLNSAGKLFYFSKVSTISEAQSLDFNYFVRKLIGLKIFFFLAVFGYILLLFRKPLFLLSLPLVGLSLFSFFGGLRFVMYGSPLAAFSVVYLFYLFFMWLMRKNIWREKKIIIYLFIFSVSMFVAFPSLKNIKHNPTSPVIFRSQIQALDTLKKKANSKDYVLTWWDYGSMVWYYSGLKTISAPSAQGDGASMFLISKIFFADRQSESANLSRWIVEKYVDYYEQEQAAGKALDFFSEDLTKTVDPNEFLSRARQGDFFLPSKTRDIYLYLPIDILHIAYSINNFSNIDVVTGRRGQEINYLIERNYKIEGEKVFLPDQMLNADFKNLILKNSRTGFELPVNAFHAVYYGADGQLQADHFVKNKKADLHVILLRDHGRILILGDKQFNSALIQMLIFENYDPKLFEPSVITPKAKIYRLKI